MNRLSEVFLEELLKLESANFHLTLSGKQLAMVQQALVEVGKKFLVSEDGLELRNQAAETAAPVDQVETHDGLRRHLDGARTHSSEEPERMEKDGGIDLSKHIRGGLKYE